MYRVYSFVLNFLALIIIINFDLELLKALFQYVIVLKNSISIGTLRFLIMLVFVEHVYEKHAFYRDKMSFLFADIRL